MRKSKETHMEKLPKSVSVYKTIMFSNFGRRSHITRQSSSPCKKIHSFTAKSAVLKVGHELYESNFDSVDQYEERSIYHNLTIVIICTKKYAGVNIYWLHECNATSSHRVHFKTERGTNPIFILNWGFSNRTI